MVSKHPIIIVGAGERALVVADSLLAAGVPVLGFLGNEPSRHGSRLCDLPVLGDDTELMAHDPASVHFANGIGGTRGDGLRFQQKLEEAGWKFVQVRHPTAVVSPFAELGRGIQLMANSVVQPGAVVGNGCIQLRRHCRTQREIGVLRACRLQCHAVRWRQSRGAQPRRGGCRGTAGVSLGEGTVAGAGAVAIHDFPGAGTLVGVPARPI